MYIEEHLKTEIKYNCDVLVCGGGIAGIAAAMSAARHGKSVILTERVFMLGGLATAGLIAIYLPLCDGLGKQVSYGIAEELLKLSISEYCDKKRGYTDWIEHPENEKNENTPRYEVNFNPNEFAILSEKLLLDLGVKLLYGTTIVSATTKDNKIDHVIAENKSGRFAIKATTVVDATGDADLAVMTNAPTETFKQGNVLASWYYYFGKEGYDLKTLGFADIPDEDKTEANKIEHLSTKRFSGLDGEEITEQTVLSHMSTMNDVRKTRKNDPSYQAVMIATIPQIRMTRKIVGEYELSHKEEHKYFEDSIGLVSDWKKRGPVYEVPFSTLYSKAVKNLIFAGRCTSTNETLWDVMRVIPCCAITGQAAGLAATMTDDFSKTNIAELQEKLRADGVIIHEQDL